MTENAMTATPLPAPIKLQTIQITICQPCLDGVGQECHTPGCALWLHRVDLPIHPEIYTIIETAELDADGGVVSVTRGPPPGQAALVEAPFPKPTVAAEAYIAKVYVTTESDHGSTEWWVRDRRDKSDLGHIHLLHHERAYTIRWPLTSPGVWQGDGVNYSTMAEALLALDARAALSAVADGADAAGVGS